MIKCLRCVTGGIFVASCVGRGARAGRLLGRGGVNDVGGPHNG